MSVRIEWSHATDRPSLIDENEARDFSDAHGSTITPGNVGLCVGEGSVMEGTREQIAAWLRSALALVETTDLSQPWPVSVQSLLDDWIDRPRLTEEAKLALMALPPERLASAIEDAFRGYEGMWYTVLDNTRGDATRALLAELGLEESDE